MERKTVAARAGHPARAGFPAALLLGLAPFGAFVLLLGLSMSMALWVAFAAAFTLGLQAFLETGKIRPFDATSTILFGLGALGAGFIPGNVPAAAVRLAVEGVLLAAMLLAFLRGAPFTRQYAPDDGRPQRHILFSAAWALALALMAVLDAAALYAGLPEAISAVLGLVALAGALTFTLRYPAIAGGTH
ncbi:MAG TPA: hypothetical protein VG889_22165 [Rhizomicrobium sp.]|nr:hypothetical protein [Rhizomicrobium sp.]